MTENTAEKLRAIFKRDCNEKWFPEKNERFVAAILEVLSPEKQGIVPSSTIAGQGAQEMTEVPEGFVMVPVEPTQEMLKAGERGIGVSSYVRKGMTIREYRFFKSGWDAMLAAAPEPKK